MKVKGLDGRTHNLVLRTSPRGNASGPHLAARELLESLFPMEQRLEEVSLPGTGGLTADFVLPGRRLIVEVQGEQHGNFVPHFHGDRSGFLRSLGRDNRKREWADLNGFRLIELKDGEQDGWGKEFE